MLVQFTIPRGTVKLGHIIDACIGECIEKWNGCTITDGLGYWKHPETGVTVAEPVAILNVECFFGIEEPSRGYLRRWFDGLAHYVQGKGEQHTVYYRIGDEARFVGPNTVTV